MLNGLQRRLRAKAVETDGFVPIVLRWVLVPRFLEL